MIREVTEEDFCPHCPEIILYMGAIDGNLVMFKCSKCGYFEVRKVSTVS